MNNLEGHPIEFFLESERLFGSELEFSIYKYVPQVLDDSRKVFTIPFGELSKGWLSGELSKLDSEFDLAIHSKVRIGKDVLYLPMIDMACDLDQLRDAFLLMRKVLPKEYIEKAFFVNSGRSYHVYVMKLLKKKEWFNFMGRILLMNFPGHKDFVDQRWVGHRIMAGYGALRWSNNNSNYLGLPRKVESINGSA